MGLTPVSALGSVSSAGDAIGDVSGNAGVGVHGLHQLSNDCIGVTSRPLLSGVGTVAITAIVIITAGLCPPLSGP